jgi:hypothetical protein
MSLKDQHLEAELRQALQRREPPEGFAERVLQRAESAPPLRAQVPRFRLLWPAAALAAATALVLSISSEYRAVQERQTQEEQAGQQVIQALRIASEELNIARNKVLNKEPE